MMATSIKTIWPSSKIRDLCDVSRGSSPRPIADQRYFEGGHIPWIKIADATKSGKFLYETKEYVNEYGASFSRLLPAGTIIVAASGTLGYTQILGVPGCAHDGWLILTNLRNFDRDYAYYVLQQMQRHFYNSAYGAAIQNINTEILRETEIPCPPLPAQRKIAAILSAYDDLVENNLRRIKILEEIAQNIYTEWFVKFRFPGHEKVKMVDSPLGRIPEGWKVESVTEAISINPPTKVPKETEKPYAGMDGLSSSSMLINITEYRRGNNGAKYRNGDTLFARITPCLENGKTVYVQFLPSDDAIGIGSTEFIVLRSKTLTPEYVYFLARSEGFRENAIKSMSGASGRQRVQYECFNKYLFPHPDNVTLAEFSRITSPVFRYIYLLSNKNENLRDIRDLLLPKLTSGELDTTDLDIKTRDDE